MLSYSTTLVTNEAEKMMPDPLHCGRYNQKPGPWHDETIIWAESAKKILAECPSGIVNWQCLKKGFSRIVRVLILMLVILLVSVLASV